MPKKSIINLGVDLKSRCLKVFPPPEAEPYRDLANFRFRLNRDQALQLARALLAATQEWEEVEVVVHRFERRKSDGAFLVSVLLVIVVSLLTQKRDVPKPLTDVDHQVIETKDRLGLLPLKDALRKIP